MHLRSPSKGSLDIFRYRIVSNVPHDTTKTVKVNERWEKDFRIYEKWYSMLLTIRKVNQA